MDGWYCWGDAAHATTPFAAMGANMAIEDSIELANLIGGCDDIEQALDDFQDLRKKRTEGIVKHGRFMARMTQLHSPLAAWLRDQAFLHMPAEEIERVTKEMASGS
jgi:2-polyprenyl-6-methoxyphenol hydroxylase-like FAD-dependent oxidoreductase